MSPVGVAEGSERPAIIESIVALAKTLGTHVIAEGVETECQARELARLGCTEAQGFFFAHPLPASIAQLRLAERQSGGREEDVLHAPVAACPAGDQPSGLESGDADRDVGRVRVQPARQLPHGERATRFEVLQRLGLRCGKVELGHPRLQLTPDPADQMVGETHDLSVQLLFGGALLGQLGHGISLDA